VRKILSTILLTTLVLSVVAVAGVVPVRAETVGTLEVSTTQFWDNAVVQVRLYDPDLNVNPSARDVATLSVTINCYNGTTYGPVAVYANESLPNSGEFYFYFANASVATPTVQNPPYGYSYYNTTWSLSSGDQIVITYNDQSPVGSVSKTVTYKQYVTSASDISFDRSSLEYPMNGYIRIYIKDLDYNLDPTSKDSQLLNITFYDVTGKKLVSQNLTFTETGPNTGVFMNETSYFTGSPYNNTYNLNFTGVSSGQPVKVEYTGESGAPFQYITLKSYTPSLSVSSAFTTAGGLKITVVDPNLNQKSWKAECIGNYNATYPYTNVTVSVSNGGDNETLAAELIEDDVNAGTFTYTLPVTIGNPVSGDGVLELRPGDSKVTITYYVFNATTASTLSTWSTQAASLTIDRTQYRSTGKVTMTLSAPDLNTDSNSINFITKTVPANNLMNYSNMDFQIGDQVVGNMTVKVNGLSASASQPITVTFVETGVNTGVFTATLDLSNVKRNDGSSLANGDTLSITYYDAINGVYSTASATIGVTAATISLDRTTLPAPRGSTPLKLYLTANDPERNNNPSIIESYNNIAWYTVYFYNGTAAIPTTPLTVTESDTNTGVFKGTITLDPTTNDILNDPALIGGWVKVLYYDLASASNLTATCYFQPTDASITTDKSAVVAGDSLTITVSDPDGNRDSKAAENVSVGVSYTDPAGNSQTPTWYLTETDVNTGVFTKTITIGKDIYVKPGTTITFTYNDPTPSYMTAASGYPSTPVQYTAKVTATSHTGTVSTDKAEYGLGSKMVVTVVDPDLNTDIYSKQTVNVIIRISGFPDYTMTLTEAGLNSPIFNGTFQWNVTAWQSNDLIGKTFYIYYKDEADASGNTVYQSCSGQVKSWDGVVTFDKSYYNVGDIVTVTVTDPDANTDPNTVQTVTVNVYSSSDPVGQTITATETGANTGVFQGKVQISSTIETGKVMAKYGDTITAKYTDALPADYATTGKSKAFTGTAVVGVPVARPVPASSQKFVDPNTGAEKTSGTVGQAIGLQATVKNVDVVSKTFTAIFKVKDASGVTISISWVTGTLAPGQELTPGVSWTPSAAGTYTVEVLVVKTLAEPTPYSDIQTKTLTVS